MGGQSIGLKDVLANLFHPGGIRHVGESHGLPPPFPSLVGEGWSYCSAKRLNLLKNTELALPGQSEIKVIDQ
jgi:hypothetical protein